MPSPKPRRPRRRLPRSGIAALVCLALCLVLALHSGSVLLPALHQHHSGSLWLTAPATCTARLDAAGIPHSWLLPGGASLPRQSPAAALASGARARQLLYDRLEAAGGASAGQGTRAPAGAAGAGRGSSPSGPLAGTQGLASSELFSRDKSGALVPILRRLETPVRAVVLPVSDPAAAEVLADAVRRHLEPAVPPGRLWRQVSSRYHATLFHASSAADPRPASDDGVAAEAEQVAAVALGSGCGPAMVLDRVVLAPGGAVVACWHVAGGADPAVIRARLRDAVPGAPERQVVKDPAILHVTLARLVPHPEPPGGADGGGEDPEQGGAPGDRGPPRTAQGTHQRDLAALRLAVERMTRELCGLRTRSDELWYIEEEETLALALRGHYRIWEAPMVCDQDRGASQTA